MYYGDRKFYPIYPSPIIEFHSISVNVCLDLDECAENSSHTCTKPNETCRNTLGSYICQCESGYEYDGYGQECNGKIHLYSWSYALNCILWKAHSPTAMSLALAAILFTLGHVEANRCGYMIIKLWT